MRVRPGKMDYFMSRPSDFINVYWYVGDIKHTQQILKHDFDAMQKRLAREGFFLVKE